MAANNVQTISNYKFVNGRDTVAIGIAMPVICVLIVGMRFLTRILQKSYVGIDDWLSAGSLVRLVTAQLTSPKSMLIPTIVRDHRHGRLPRSWSVLVHYCMSDMFKLYIITGARARVMGYPTPAPPPQLTGDQLLAYLDPTSQIAEEVSHVVSPVLH